MMWLVSVSGRAKSYDLSGRQGQTRQHGRCGRQIGPMRGAKASRTREAMMRRRSSSLSCWFGCRRGFGTCSSFRRVAACVGEAAATPTRGGWPGQSFGHRPSLLLASCQLEECSGALTCYVSSVGRGRPEDHGAGALCGVK